MRCAGDMVLSKRLTLCCSAFICSSPQLIIPIMKTIPGFWDFGVQPNKGIFNFLKEDYYV
jgi:hypothetical protein